MKTNSDITRDILNTIREIKENKTIHKNYGLLNEENKTERSIAITDDPRFGQQVLSSQIEQFRTSVEGGAEFTDPSVEDVASSPLIFMPKTKNLVFSGVIPCLNNLKFQMVLRTNTGSGLFIWTDGMIINEENLKIITKLKGFYENWKNQWQAESGDLERLANSL